MALQTYPGNCHCGAFRFVITCPPITSAKECDCSLCSKKRYLWIDIPVTKFAVVRGVEEELTGYSFGVKKTVHKFCPTCGTGILMRRLHEAETKGGEEEVRINVRALLDIDPFQLKTEKINDLASKLAYKPPIFQGDLPAGDEVMKLYTGSCHCGAVTVAVKSKPLPQAEVREDNCSICRRNGNIAIYPTRPFVRLVGPENTTMYRFGKGYVGHPFCKTCGVQVYMHVFGPEVKESWSEEMRKMVREKCEIVPVRVAVLEGVEWSKMKVERSDEGTEGYVLGP